MEAAGESAGRGALKVVRRSRLLQSTLQNSRLHPTLRKGQGFEIHHLTLKFYSQPEPIANMVSDSSRGIQPAEEPANRVRELKLLHTFWVL